MKRIQHSTLGGGKGARSEVW